MLFTAPVSGFNVVSDQCTADVNCFWLYQVIFALQFIVLYTQSSCDQKEGDLIWHQILILKMSLWTVRFIFSIKAVCPEILNYDLIQRAAPQTQNNSYKCQLARGAI